jgi:hypothetical protein
LNPFGPGAQSSSGYLFGPKICGRRCFNSTMGDRNPSPQTGGRTVRSVNTPDGTGLANRESVRGSARDTRVPQMMIDDCGWKPAERAAGGAGRIVWASQIAPKAITRHTIRARLAIVASRTIIRLGRARINGF